MIVSVFMLEAEPTGVLFDIFVIVLAQWIVRPILEWKRTFVKWQCCWWLNEIFVCRKSASSLCLELVNKVVLNNSAKLCNLISLSLIFFIFIIIILKTGSYLYSPGWPQTHSVAKTGQELTNLAPLPKCWDPRNVLPHLGVDFNTKVSGEINIP